MRRRNDRAVSIAVTHVLTIAVTTILLAGLLIGASTVLDREQTRSGEQSLETIGERLATELERVDRLAEGSEEVRVYADHPRTAAGSSYTVELTNGDDCGELITGDCLRLTAHGGSAVATVPVDTSTSLDYGSGSGGGVIVISYTDDDSEITIRSDSP